MAAEPRTRPASGEPSIERAIGVRATAASNGIAAASTPDCTEAARHQRCRDPLVDKAIERFEGPLVRYAARITGDLERGRDVVQETFLRLCREPEVAASDHLAQWLFTVCRRLAIDVRRKETRMSTQGDAAAVCELPHGTSRYGNRASRAGGRDCCG